MSSMRWDDRKDIQFVKQAWSIFHSELKARIPPPLKRNKGWKTNERSKINMDKIRENGKTDNLFQKLHHNKYDIVKNY